jgi:Multimeric flavodoxin WrbA
MKSVVVVYFSGSGHTHLMAEAIAEGVRQVADVSVELVRIHGEQIVNGRWQDGRAMEKLDRADAIVFGSPTYMGGVAAQFKAFIDAASSRWCSAVWS